MSIIHYRLYMSIIQHRLYMSIIHPRLYMSIIHYRLYLSIVHHRLYISTIHHMYRLYMSIVHRMLYLFIISHRLHMSLNLFFQKGGNQLSLGTWIVGQRLLQHYNMFSFSIKYLCLRFLCQKKQSKQRQVSSRQMFVKWLGTSAEPGLVITRYANLWCFFSDFKGNAFWNLSFWDQ